MIPLVDTDMAVVTGIGFGDLGADNCEAASLAFMTY